MEQLYSIKKLNDRTIQKEALAEDLLNSCTVKIALEMQAAAQKERRIGKVDKKII